MVRSIRIERGGSISTEMTNCAVGELAGQAGSAEWRRSPPAAVSITRACAARPRLRDRASGLVGRSPCGAVVAGRRELGRADPAVARLVAPRASIAARIALVWTGVVPQQPPRIRAPAASICGTISPKYSGPAE